MSAEHRIAIVILVTAAAGAFVARMSSEPAPPGSDPSGLRIEYRPGGYFPEGFPLHGKVRLLTSPVVEMGQRARIRVEYTVGDMPIETGMAIEVWKHFTSDVEEFQVTDAGEPAYFGVEFSAPGVRGRPMRYTNWVQRNEFSVFPYRKTAAVVIEQGRLTEGDKVLFDLGGERGVRMQHYEENLFNFRFVITKDERPLGYAGDAALKVTGGPLARLRVVGPSVVNVGEVFAVEVVPMDEWASLAKNHRGLELRISSGDVSGGSFRYEPALMHYVARDVTAHQEGVVRIGVQTADGRYKGVSNPIWVERNPVRRVYFGELHQHTYLHDGRGVYEELYLYGRRVGLLDFGAVTPHHVPMSVSGPSFHLGDKQWPSENWPALTKATKLMNGWEGLVSILGYEYSVGTNVGGHHNIFFNADEAKSTMQLDPTDPRAPIGKMLRTVQFARVPTLVIPHIGGGPPDWSHPPDGRIERLFEVASVHGVFEESWQRHLEAGLRQGVIAAGDTHTTSMGIAYPGLNYVMTNGLAGVYARDKTRAEIWDGLYERRSFATTGNQRMLVDFEVNGERMGGEISSKLNSQARVRARVSGTAPLVRVDLLKNSKVIHTLRPSRNRGKLLRVVWGDNVYQRRAVVGRTQGELRAAKGHLRLREVIHRDQAFEIVREEGGRIVWNTAAVSNDRDGFLADISEAAGSLEFRLDDSEQLGVFEVSIPVEGLQREGYFAWSQKSDRVKHSYMAKMGVAPEFFLECELVNPEGPMDVALEYEDREGVKPGDYYYVRAEQLDTNKAWSSPVWVN